MRLRQDEEGWPAAAVTEAFDMLDAIIDASRLPGDEDELVDVAIGEGREALALLALIVGMLAEDQTDDIAEWSRMLRNVVPVEGEAPAWREAGFDSEEEFATHVLTDLAELSGEDNG